MKNSLGATGFTYCVATFFSFTAPQMIEACQQLICSKRQKPSGALNPPKCSANFLQIPGHNTCATYISFGSEPKQSPYIYHKCLCIYETTKTLGAFLHSQNFEIEALHIATKRIQTPENKLKPNSRKRKHLEFSRTLADLLTFQNPKHNLKTLLSLQNQGLGFVHPAQ
jgi:hypothetical protein